MHLEKNKSGLWTCSWNTEAVFHRTQGVNLRKGYRAQEQAYLDVTTFTFEASLPRLSVSSPQCLRGHLDFYMHHEVDCCETWRSRKSSLVVKMESLLPDLDTPPDGPCLSIFPQMLQVNSTAQTSPGSNARSTTNDIQDAKLLRHDEALILR